MKIEKWLKQFSVKLEFKLQDFFIGFYWKKQKNIYGFKHLDLWICIIPTLPIHIHCLIGRDRLIGRDPQPIPEITELS